MSQNRREFIKNCSMGIGAMLASNIFLTKLKAGVSPVPGSSEFQNMFGVTKEEIQKLLSLCLSKGGDFADLFFEYRTSSSVTMEEDILKSSSESISIGVGVRVLNGEQTGFGYTNEMTYESIKAAALTAAAIAESSKNFTVNLNPQKPAIQVYDLKSVLADKTLEEKIELVKIAYNSAKSYDSRIKKVSSSLADELQYVTIANTDGLLISDTRPQARLSVVSTAEDKGIRNTGHHSAGGRIGYDFYKTTFKPEEIGKKSAEEAIILLSAKNAEPGEQTVVLSKDQSGVMIHEAVGHPLEADGAWKKHQ